MEKVIKIDLLKEEYIHEKYDREIINHELIDYIIKKSRYTKEENIKIIINNKCNTKVNVIDKIIEGLKVEYEKTIKENKRDNIFQVILLALGITFLFLSTLVTEDFIWKEILLIGGWVPIWEMADIEFFKEFRGKRKRLLIYKLMNSEYIQE